VIVGGPGSDLISGGNGNDTIRAKDRRRDRVKCGAGRDTAYVDRIDKVAGCEVRHF
jgi:Ca2+-binding RTX toxin-like protein